MSPSSRSMILLSLFPSICLAALQPRPISTFPTDPHAAPKFDVAFLNHLPIGRREAAYWAGTGGLRNEDKTTEGENRAKRETRTSEESGRQDGRRHRDNAQREEDLLAIRLRAQADHEKRLSHGLATNTASQTPITSENGLITPDNTHHLQTHPYPLNPIERSFLSGSFALDILLEELAYPDQGSDEAEAIHAQISDGVEYAYDALVYAWSRTNALDPSRADQGDGEERFLMIDGRSHVDAESQPRKTFSSGFRTGPAYLDGQDLPPTSLLPTFKILKLPSSRKHIPYPAYTPNTPLPSQSSPSKPNSEPAHDQLGKIWHSRGEHHLPTTDYLCMTPSVYTQRANEAARKTNRTETLREIEDGRHSEDHVDGNGKEIDPWDYLRHLEGKCLFHRQGWFTYAYCHGSHVRQFRGVAVQNGQGGSVPLEDMSFDAYNLGLSVATFDKLEIAAVNRADETNSPIDYNDMDPPPLLPLEQLRMTTARVEYEEERRKMGNTVRSSRRTDQQKKPMGVPELRPKGGAGSTNTGIDKKDKHLSVTWGFGTGCAIAGIRRQVEIQFHCRMDGVDEIAYVKEVRTCQYILIIHTPRLCVIPGFHTPSPADLPSHGIKCRQIVPDDRVQYSQTAREWSMKLAAQRRIGNPDIEDAGGAEVATVRDQLVQDRVDKLKLSGGRVPAGVAGPTHLYEWIDDGPPKPKQAPSKAGTPIPELEPVTVPFEDEDGEIHEITVEFVIGDDEDDDGGFNEWGDEIAKLPKAKRRKLSTEQDADAEENPEAKKAYIAKKREENKVRREKAEALKRAGKEVEAKDNRLSAKMETWWKGMTKKTVANADAEERDKDDKEREL